MYPVIRIALYLFIVCIGLLPELSYASNRKIIVDTLQPTALQSTSKQVVVNTNADSVRGNRFLKPVIKPDTPFGLIASGLGAICALILGIGLMGGRSTYAGEIFYPLGIIFVVIGGLFVTLFFVNINRRNRALRGKKPSD